MKVARLALIVVIAMLAVGTAALMRLDLPRATLIAKYPDARSRFVALPDGTIAHVRLEGPTDKPAAVLPAWINGLTAKLGPLGVAFVGELSSRRNRPHGARTPHDSRRL